MLVKTSSVLCARPGASRLVWENGWVRWISDPFASVETASSDTSMQLLTIKTLNVMLYWKADKLDTHECKDEPQRVEMTRKTFEKKDS